MSKLIERRRCPECAKAGKDNHEDNLGVYDDGHQYCFACGYLGGTSGSPAGSFTYEYLPWRGIDKSVMREYDILTKIDVTGRPVELGFRYPNGSVKIRKVDTKDFYFKTEAPKPEPGLFGMDKFAAGCAEHLIITEGEIDAPSFRQVLRSVPVVSVQGSSSAHRDLVSARSYLASFKRIYLAFDGDRAGQLATDACAKLFEYDRVYQIRFTRPDRKDANDYIRVGEQSELLALYNSAKRYVPDTLVHSNEDFKKILEEEPKPGVPYPAAFCKLNDMTYGMRTGESVLLTAMEGVGKTEIMHSIEYQLLRETDDAIGAIFLEEPKKRHLNALAGIHLGRPIHLPDQAVAPAIAFEALGEVLKKDDRLYLYSNFGSVEPGVLCDTIRFLVSGCGVRWVILDHISMVCSGLSGIKDERREIDAFSTQLETMVKELDFGLLMVSHVNDNGLTRSSRFPAKVADMRIDAFRDLMHPDPITRNTIRLSISKNRYCGRTGSAGCIQYIPDSNIFQEVSDSLAGSTGAGDMKVAVWAADPRVGIL